MKLVELIQLLRSEPWQSIRSMSERLQTSRRFVDKLLNELELESRKGRDPVTGRRCLVFAINLPDEKRKAV